MASSQYKSEIKKIGIWLGEHYSLERINKTGEELVEITEVARNEIIREIPQFRIFQQNLWPKWILDTNNNKENTYNTSRIYNPIRDFIEDIIGTASTNSLKDIEKELGKCNSSLWRLYIESVAERSLSKIKNKPKDKTDARILYAWLRELARTPANNSIMIIAKTALHTQDEFDNLIGKSSVRIGPESILYTYAHMYHELGLKLIIYAGYRLPSTNCIHDLNPTFSQICANSHGENNFNRKIAKAIYPLLYDEKNLYKAHRIYYNSKVIDPNYLYAARGHEQIIIFGGNPFEIRKVASSHLGLTIRNHSTLAKTLFINAMEESGFEFSDEKSIHLEKIDGNFKARFNITVK